MANAAAPSESRFDLEHIAGVCDEAVRAVDTRAEPAHVQSTPMAAYAALATESHHLTALHALRRVGYAATTMTSPQTPLMSWIRVVGWDRDLLLRRLDGLTVTAHQLARDLPNHVAHAIDAFAAISDLPDLDAPQYRAAAGLRSQLRDQTMATTGPRAPYDPDRLPGDPELATLIKRVRAQEHHVDDLISRTWLTGIDAIARYAELHRQDPHGPTRAEALTDALNPLIGLAKRDALITMIEWAREAGHGDAVDYAHWYAHTYGTCEDGPDPATAYDTWRNDAAVQHPAAIAARDLPDNIQIVREVFDASDTRDRDQAPEQNTPQRGRRAS